MSERDQTFANVLLECVDEGLAVLGNEPRQAVYQYLQTICSLSRDDIPTHVSDFVAGLKKALGGASKVIERMILRKLYERTGSNFREIPDADFNDYVIEAKRRFEILSHRHDDAIDGARSKKGQFAG